MKIGVVSDTHGRPLPPQMLQDFKTVDLIVHAGDIGSLETLKTLSALQEVKAVYGNMDGADIREEVPADMTISCGNQVIGIYHGEGAPKSLLEKVGERFRKTKVDVIIFGHSHESFNEVRDGILYFNPGTPNDRICASCCSYGILTVSDKGIKGQIIKVK
ncbi:MAG TPA: metallophosphoesterase family protein [Candidatus Omnitrophota bacterium]|nr:metallophosphoesterase family protein [Candidatus Omnitrophota bacterium]HPB67741.1 metallophosphoesterase family protein [Candidatus Omnitrophota bacterium]HQO57521.1 metallophosphoesterase family protein [Candidatus Omnitrophota bacterium]HQP11228.1 metallophosphoesterase family protein [Candidatus Omnitrophota bacterium]